MTFPIHVSVDRLTTSHSRRIESLVDRAVPSVAPALALCVWQAGQPVLDIHGGWIDPQIPGNPVHGDAIFDLASLSKLFTASAFLGLVNEGKIGLDDPVVSVLPEYAADPPRSVDGGQEPLSRRMLPVPDDRSGWTVDPTTVTFRQLLTHTSGMSPWRSIFQVAGPPPPPPGEPDTLGAAERRQAGLVAAFKAPFVAQPGVESHYSDLGFMTLGAAVAQLADDSLEEVVTSRLAAPLELASLTYAPVRNDIDPVRVVPTSFDDDWRMRRCWGEVEDENAAGLGGVAGHAGLFGTARDMARFGQAWLSGAAALGLEPRIYELAITDQTLTTAAARGLGWQVHGRGSDFLSPLGPGSFGHTGFTGTSLAIDPSRDLVAALLTNRVYAGRTHEGIDDLRAQVHEALAEAFD